MVEACPQRRLCDRDMPGSLLTVARELHCRHANLAYLAIVAALFAPASPAQQAFPVKPVRIVVSAAAGTGLDATTRLIAPKLSDYWKQPTANLFSSWPGSG